MFTQNFEEAFHLQRIESVKFIGYNPYEGQVYEKGIFLRGQSSYVSSSMQIAMQRTGDSVLVLLDLKSYSQGYIAFLWYS